WIGRPDRPAAATLAWLVGGPRRDVAAGIGAASHGIDGFARTHRQAQQALRAGLVREATVTAYDDVALEALCSIDPSAAADFAHHRLGALLITYQGATL